MIQGHFYRTEMADKLEICFFFFPCSKTDFTNVFWRHYLSYFYTEDAVLNTSVCPLVSQLSPSIFVYQFYMIPSVYKFQNLENRNITPQSKTVPHVMSLNFYLFFYLVEK